jgi:predicted nucleic acid-binding protein
MERGVILADSNLIIYAVQPDCSALRSWFLETLPVISVISRVEVLGYHQLKAQEQNSLEDLLNALETVYPTPATFELAIGLRQRRRMLLGDALIAATCIEHGCVLATHNTGDFAWVTELNLLDPHQPSSGIK